MRSGRLAAPAASGGQEERRPRTDDRKVLNGIFFILRTGSPWRDLPERYGPYTTAYNRFNRWGKKASGWPSSRRWRHARRKSLHLIDSSIVRGLPARCRQKKAGPDHAIGRSRGGLSTELHVVVDGCGLPLRVVVSPGQASDKAVAPALLTDLA